MNNGDESHGKRISLNKRKPIIFPGLKLEATQTHSKIHGEKTGWIYRVIYQKKTSTTYHPWDWYIYLHLVDVYGKCRQIYYRPIAFVMASKLSQKICPILPSDARQFNGKFGSKDRQDPSDGTRRNKPHVWRGFFGGAEIETTTRVLSEFF